MATAPPPRPRLRLRPPTSSDPAAALCLRDAAASPVYTFADNRVVSPVPDEDWVVTKGQQLYGWAEVVLDCLDAGRRVFWLQDLHGEAEVLLTPEFRGGTRLGPRVGVCVPSACNAAHVGAYFLALAMDEPGRPRAGRQSIWGHGGCRRSIWRTGMPIGLYANETYEEPRRWGYLYRLEPPSAPAPPGQLGWYGLATVAEHALDRSPPPALQALPGAPSGVAVCFAGRFRAVRLTVDTARVHLVEALGADVFGLFSVMRQDLADRRMRDIFPARVQRVAVVRDLTRQQLITEFKRSGRLPWYLTSNAGALSPVVHGAPQLHMLRKISACLDLIDAHEVSRGFRYERVISSRLDTLWAAAHPPLAVLDPAAIWIPCLRAQDMGRCGTDADGLDDTHAVLARSHAEVYMRRWDLLLQGRAHLVPDSTGHAFLKILLSLQFRIPVRRFTPMAALSCCHSAWRCSNRYKQNCTGQWRSTRDRDTVLKHAAALRAAGGRWGETPPGGDPLIAVKPMVTT